MKKKLILIITSSILILSFLIFFLLSINSKKYDIVVLDELSTPYINDIEKDYNVKTTSNSTIYTYLDEARAIELDEYSAKSIIAAGLGKKFISYYNAKTVLVKNKDKTNVDIKSLNELKNSNVSVNIVNSPALAAKMVNLSISYIVGNEFKLDNAISYYKDLYDQNRLNHNYNATIPTDYLLTTDFEARRHQSENIEIFDIEEGTLITNIGLLILDDTLDLTKY